MVLALDQRHAAGILDDYPLLEPKSHCLEKDVRDPWGGPLAKYREVRDDLGLLLSRFIDFITAG